MVSVEAIVDDDTQMKDISKAADTSETFQVSSDGTLIQTNVQFIRYQQNLVKTHLVYIRCALFRTKFREYMQYPVPDRTLGRNQMLAE